MKIVTKSAAILLVAGILTGCASQGNYYHPAKGVYTPSCMAPYKDSPSFASKYAHHKYKANYGYQQVPYKPEDCCKR